MEPTDFLERIQNRTLLKNDKADDWNALVKEYPYASIVQLLNFQSKEKTSKSEIDVMRVHFENPLHFNAVTKGHQPNVSEEVNEEKQAELKKELEELLSEENESDVKEAAAEIVVEQPPISQKEEEVVIEKVADEDVLKLIKDLPEENPIEKAKVEESVSEDQVEEDSEESDQVEDPGDLMVMMSFTDWLQYFKAKKENEEEDKKGRDAIRSAWQKEKLAEAMDDEEDVVPDDIFEKAMKSVSFGDGLVTEPLAELYVQQGKTDKAIELYKKLSLLNPEKRTYFASRIKDLHL